MLTASSDKTARLWDPETGRCKQILEGHTDEIFSCAFNYEGNTIITGEPWLKSPWFWDFVWMLMFTVIFCLFLSCSWLWVYICVDKRLPWFNKLTFFHSWIINFDFFFIVETTFILFFHFEFYFFKETVVVLEVLLKFTRIPFKIEWLAIFTFEVNLIKKKIHIISWCKEVESIFWILLALTVCQYMYLKKS